MLNGTWSLVPTEHFGNAALQAATITIDDRQHNIYISRNFTYEGRNETTSMSFTTDSREHATIREGKTFKSRAKWDGDVLKVTTVGDQVTEKEQYSLRPDGLLMLVLERPGNPPLTLYFNRE
jgi:hypothetical protein